jgi:N-acetylglucosaminyl-diphospho-decaprenol L-rhamnosyltransferase
MAMSLTVGVITHNAQHIVGDLLRSLADGLDGVARWRLVVADSGSRDATVDLVRRETPHALILEGANDGFAAQVNRIAAADPLSDAVFILSQTGRLRPGCVAPLLAALAEPGVGIVVPYLFDGDDRPLASLRRKPTLRRAWAEAVFGGTITQRFASLSHIVGRPDRYGAQTRFDWATGGATMVSRACLDKTGPWDETFFLYSEELEFELRAAEHGFGLKFVPGARMVHLGGDSHVNADLWALLCANQVRVYAMRHNRVAAHLFWASRMAGEFLRRREHAATHRAAIGKLVAERANLVAGRPAAMPVGFA